MRISTSTIVALAACATSATAFVSPQARTTFTLRSSLDAISTNPATRRARRGVSGIEMKRKGKPNSNIANRGAFNQMQQKEAQYRDQKRAMDSGMPGFQIYVRTTGNKMWFPCGMMMGDEKAKATVDAMMGGLLSGISKYSLEKGVAGSVLQRKKELIKQVVMAYPDLAKQELIFGYKVIYKALEEKMGAQKVTEITKDMTLGPLDAFKKSLGF